MRLFVTGGIGVLGRATIPLLVREGHEIDAPLPNELDLFDPGAVARAVEGSDGVLHLATRIPPRELADDREAWRENDRLRTDASRLLVDAALSTGTLVYVQPSVSFLYPAEGVVDEETRLGEVPEHLRSALAAEGEAARFAAAGRRGVVLRLGLLDGPGTGNETPSPRYGTTLHVADAGHALVAALGLPSGIYNVCRDGEHVSNERLKEVCGWTPEH
jgi:nucleoside-diphosphate-sugar epimerase